LTSQSYPCFNVSMTSKTDTLMLGRRHFLVEFVGKLGPVASLWVPTELGASDDTFVEGEKFARLNGEPLRVRVGGEDIGVRVLP
jgi:hypothetical protein